MSVYPERRHGRLTGRFVVEVQIGKTRLRKVTADYSKTGEIEDELAIRIGNGEGTAKIDNREPVAPRNLIELLARGENAIWGGTTLDKSAPAAIRRAANIIGDRRLTDITTHDIDRVVEKLRKLNLAPGTINRNLSAIHRLLTWGRERGWGPKGNISIDWQEEPEQTLRLINDGEDARIVAQLDTQGPKGEIVADFARVSLMTGLRRSELLSRQPEHLYVSQGRTWLRVTQTKTKTERAVPLTDDVAAILRARLPWKVYAHDVRRQWDQAKEALGLAGDSRVVLHALRHTFGTRLVRAGVDAFTAKELLGHANLATTQRYVHVASEMKASAIDKLSSEFSPVTRGVGEHPVGDKGGSR